MKKAFIIFAMLLSVAGCRSQSPYVEEIWRSGGFMSRNGPGYKGGSVTYEQIVLFDNRRYAHTQTHCGLMPFATRHTKTGEWGSDRKGTYLLSGTNRIYLSEVRADVFHPYKTNYYVRIFCEGLNVPNKTNP